MFLTLTPNGSNADYTLLAVGQTTVTARIGSVSNALPITVYTNTNTLAPLLFSTSAFDDGGVIPTNHHYTIPGFGSTPNQSPPLSWENPPAGTESFVIIVHDTHHLAGNWVHWIAYDIPPDITNLAGNIGKNLIQTHWQH